MPLNLFQLKIAQPIAMQYAFKFGLIQYFQ